MAARKRHVQTTLPLERDKNGQRRGKARTKPRSAYARLGRPPRDPSRPSQPHQRRPTHDARHPVHVTLRVVDAVGHLRRPKLWRAIRRALLVTAARDAFRIVHLSVQGNHLHLLCEADDSDALMRGLQGFQISAAKRIHAELMAERGRRSRGRVFADRYHARAIDSVRQIRNALSYVLNNWRHHAGHRGPALFGGRLDPYSSGIWFLGWRERTVAEVHVPADYDPPRVCRARTWLLAEGYKRAGPISVWEVPGPAGRTR